MCSFILSRHRGTCCVCLSSSSCRAVSFKGHPRAKALSPREELLLPQEAPSFLRYPVQSVISLLSPTTLCRVYGALSQMKRPRFRESKGIDG